MNKTENLRYGIVFALGFDEYWSPRRGMPMARTLWGARRVQKRLESHDWLTEYTPRFRIYDRKNERLVA